MMLRFLRFKLKQVLEDIRGEWRIAPESEFTAEQKAAFDRLIDFLADMVEKYAPVLDEIQNEVTPKKQTA